MIFSRSCLGKEQTQIQSYWECIPQPCYHALDCSFNFNALLIALHFPIVLGKLVVNKAAMLLHGHPPALLASGAAESRTAVSQTRLTRDCKAQQAGSSVLWKGGSQAFTCLQSWLLLRLKAKAAEHS